MYTVWLCYTDSHSIEIALPNLVELVQIIQPTLLVHSRPTSKVYSIAQINVRCIVC